MKKKIQFEYLLNSISGAVIWDMISTPAGLQHWFADKVTRAGKLYTFQWGKTETRTAELTKQRTDSFVRFHWTDDEPYTYFEMLLAYDELTTDFLLEVTDFAEEDEVDDLREIWDSQVMTLKRTCGL